MTADHDAWSAGQSYERYMGRWSRMIASMFVDWLDAPSQADWLEIGCGTGALTSTVLCECRPRSILATDPSGAFVSHAREAIDDRRARFATAEAQALPLDDGSVDVVASALVLNFVPDRRAALAEMQRVLRPRGSLAFYVWDYPGGGIGFIDAFWRAAAALDPAAAALDESKRFPFCSQDGLRALCAEADLPGVEIAPLEIRTEFPDFDAFWHPFTLGAGPAPGYCRSLDEERRAALKARLAAEIGPATPVSLGARAWAVRATPG
jgi:SAM-dependent methyltransferase